MHELIEGSSRYNNGVPRLQLNVLSQILAFDNVVVIERELGSGFRQHSLAKRKSTSSSQNPESRLRVRSHPAPSQNSLADKNRV